MKALALRGSDRTIVDRLNLLDFEGTRSAQKHRKFADPASAARPKRGWLSKPKFTRQPGGNSVAIDIPFYRTAFSRGYILSPLPRLGQPGDRAKRQEAETTERLLAHLDDGRPLSEWSGEIPAELEPLTTKPLIPLENGPDGIDCALEMELAELAPEEAAEFRSGPSALDDVVFRLKETLGLVTFFTVGDTEARSWTLQEGQTALDAAESIHSDIARGFIRCEVIRWDDLLECGSHAEAARRGLQRLEGKTYVVQDGDVLNIRFNV